MMKPDLHMHTTSSDGLLPPRELVRLAARQGVTLMAVTDHDTFAGYEALAGEETPITVLQGVELSLRDMNGLHLLGYGLRVNTPLHAVVKDLADRRLHRARMMVERLCELGYPLDYDAICAECEGTVGRLHIARAMVEHGYVVDTNEAFDRFIGEDCPAYVSGERLSMAEALPLMHRSGFVPVLAHPYELDKEETTLRMLVQAWHRQGLMGMEVYHPSAMSRGHAALDSMARSIGLLVTGGSDYHCDDGRHGQPGCTAAAWRDAAADAAALLQAMQAINP
ncbi:MAG: PHP domain-containing protein [Clostridia bacterium]|nr:PHP domain-containing protein [Clostridia bacterium]